MIFSGEKRNSDKNQDSGLALSCHLKTPGGILAGALDWTPENRLVVPYWRLLAVRPQITLKLLRTVFFY